MKKERKITAPDGCEIEKVKITEKMDAKTFVQVTSNWQHKTFTLRLFIIGSKGTKKEKYRTRKLREDEFCRWYFADDDFWLEKIKTSDCVRLR